MNRLGFGPAFIASLFEEPFLQLAFDGGMDFGKAQTSEPTRTGPGQLGFSLKRDIGVGQLERDFKRASVVKRLRTFHRQASGTDVDDGGIDLFAVQIEGDRKLNGNPKVALLFLP